MSNKSDGFVKVKDKIPYHGKGVDELVMSLKRVLNMPENKYTQKIVLEVGVPHIYIEKLVSQDEAGNLPVVSLKDVIRTRPIEEYEPESKMNAFEHFMEMFNIVQKEGLEVGFIAVGNKTSFQKWLGVRIPTTDMRLFGIQVSVVEDLPDDVFVLCGTRTRMADPDDVEYSLKGYTYETVDKKAV